MAFWAAAAPILGSMAGGALNSYIGNRTSKDGSMGYDMPYMDRAPWDYTNQDLSAQMAQDAARNAMLGRLPAGQEILLEKIRKEQLRRAQEEMYGAGLQGRGGIMGNTMAMGAMGGVGPKAMMAQGSRAMNDYASRNAQIQNYIDSLKFTGLQKGTADAYDMMQKMPRSAAVPYTGHVVPMNTPAQPGMNTGLQNVDWGEVINNYRKPAQPTQQQVVPMKAAVTAENDAWQRLLSQY
jgi:hypothetical protein